MKKILILLSFFLLLPLTSYASITAPWNASSTDKGFISPNLINGNSPGLTINALAQFFQSLTTTFFNATSTTATSTIAFDLTVGSNTNNPLFQIGSVTPSYGYLVQDRENITDNRNDYSADNSYNLSSGSCATADKTAANDLNSTAVNFVDLGHTSSGFTGFQSPGVVCPNNPFTGFGSNAGYIFDPNDDLILATQSGRLRFFSGGYAIGNERISVLSTGETGIGSTSPFAQFAIHAPAGNIDTTLFAISSSTASATTSLVAILNTGNVGIGTSTPGTLLSIQGIANFTTATTTHSSTGGINLLNGCFAVRGTCIGSGGGGAVSSVTAGDSSLNISPNTGAVIAALNTSNPTIWSVTQTFNVSSGDAISAITSDVADGITAVGGSFGVNGTGGAGFAGVLGQGNATSYAIEGLGGTNYFSGNVGIGSSTAGSLLSIGNTGWNFYDNATSTDSGAGGLNILAGCYAIRGTCIGSGGGGSGTVGSGTTGQFPFYNANGTTLTATSSLFVAQNQNIGIGTTSPWTYFAIATPNGAVNQGTSNAQNCMFSIASSTTAGATTTEMSYCLGTLLTTPVLNLNGNLNITNASGASFALQIAGSTRYAQSTTNSTWSTGANPSSGVAHYVFNGVADSALTATVNMPYVNLNDAVIRTHATGAISEQDDFLVQNATHNFAAGTQAASTINLGSGMTVNGVPLVGAHSTITNAFGLYLNGAANEGSFGTAASSTQVSLYSSAPVFLYNAASSAKTGYAAIFNYESGTPGTAGLTLQPGLVGIGTSTPQAELQIQNAYPNNFSGVTGFNGTEAIFTISSSTSLNQNTSNVAFTVLAGNTGLGNPVGLGTSTPTAEFTSIAASTTAGTVETSQVGVVSIIGGVVNAVTEIFETIGQWGDRYTGGDAPVLTSCGTSPSFIGAANMNDQTIQVGSVAATGCTTTFAHPWKAAPTCNVTERTGSVVNAMTYTVSATAVVISQTGLTGDILDIRCEGTQ